LWNIEFIHSETLDQALLITVKRAKITTKRYHSKA